MTESSSTRCCIAFGLLALLLLERFAPQVGLWMLAAVSVSVALVHGALDAVLLRRRVCNVRQTLGLATIYLLITLAAGAAALQWTAQALMLLLPLSVWHFGEAFGPADEATVWQCGMRRLLRGGAPVLLPVLLNADAMRGLIADLAPSGSTDATTLWLVWRAFGVAWALLVVVRICGWLLRRELADEDHVILQEVGLLTLAYLLLSPLLAFTAFFASLHCGAHILRVLASAREHGAQRQRADAIWLSATVLLSLAVTAGFMWLDSTLHSQPAQAFDAGSLPLLVAALAAVSLPHAILISHAAAELPASALQGTLREGQYQYGLLRRMTTAQLQHRMPSATSASRILEQQLPG